MTTTQPIKALVTDTNGRVRGKMAIAVEFHQGLPCEVIHDGQTYVATGKDGTHRRPAGKRVRWPPRTTPASGSPWTARTSGKTEPHPLLQGEHHDHPNPTHRHPAGRPQPRRRSTRWPHHLFPKRQGRRPPESHYRAVQQGPHHQQRRPGLVRRRRGLRRPGARPTDAGDHDASADIEAAVSTAEANGAQEREDAAQRLLKIGVEGKPRTRENSKQAKVIGMLQRTEGATVQQIWRPQAGRHTRCAALSPARSRRSSG